MELFERMVRAIFCALLPAFVLSILGSLLWTYIHTDYHGKPLRENVVIEHRPVFDDQGKVVDVHQRRIGPACSFESAARNTSGRVRQNAR